MLHAIYAPTDFKSIDQEPSLSAPEKLAIIDNSPVELHVGIRHPDRFRVSLPFVAGGTFDYGIKGYQECLLTDYVNVGDRALYHHGIGSRLLRSACRYAVEQDERITELQTGWARLGLVNTAIRVFGQDKVGVDNGGTRYGWGGDRPLEAVFDDHAPTKGKRYVVFALAASIDRDLAMTWEEPVLAAR